MTYVFSYLDNGLLATTQQGASQNFKFFFTEDVFSHNNAAQVTGSPSAAYIYNKGTEKLNRLTQAVLDDGTNTYAFDYLYDARGNIREMDIFTGGSVQQQTFSYNDDNQITNTGFAYDDAGNLTSAVIKGDTFHYVYDKANRLIQVLDGSSQEISSYTYDSQGQRLTKTVGSDTITYHYFNGTVLYETRSGDANNILHALYFRSAQGKALAVSLNYDLTNPTANTWYYYHYNAHGDVTVVTDGNGNIFREYVYDPYGNVISVKDGNGIAITDLEADSFNHAYTYAGYRYDAETGLYYLNARYYAAGIGRFLSKDPLKGIGTGLQTLNRYAYCIGDPVNLTDPSGHGFWDSAKNLWSKFTGAVSNAKNTVVSWFSGDSGADETEISPGGALALGVAKSGSDAAFGYYIGTLPEDKLIGKEGGGAIRTYKQLQGVKALKGFSKIAGPVAVGSLTFDVYGAYRAYQHSSMPYAATAAIGLTAVGAGAGIAAGVVLGILGAPVIAGVVASAFIGVLASKGAEDLKEKWITR